MSATTIQARATAFEATVDAMTDVIKQKRVREKTRDYIKAILRDPEFYPDGHAKDVKYSTDLDLCDDIYNLFDGLDTQYREHWRKGSGNYA